MSWYWLMWLLSSFFCIIYRILTFQQWDAPYRSSRNAFNASIHAGRAQQYFIELFLPLLPYFFHLHPFLHDGLLQLRKAFNYGFHLLPEFESRKKIIEHLHFLTFVFFGFLRFCNPDNGIP